jgi:hypothetical protein
MALELRTKQVFGRWRSVSQPMRLYLIASVLLATIIPILLMEFDYNPLQTLLATILLETCLYPTARYFAQKESGLPTMPILSVAYALQFAIPFYTHDATMELSHGDLKYLADADVSAALLMAIVGVGVLQAGYYWFQQSEIRKAAPVAILNLNKGKAVLYCALAGIVLPLLFTFKGIIPDEYQQPLSSVLRLLENQVLVVIGVLGWIVYSRSNSKWYTVWLYLLVVSTAVRGISSGSLETALVPIGVLFFVKWAYTRRIAFAPIVVTIVMVLFLSPVKSDYREKVWYGETAEITEMSTLEKTIFWIGEATDYWLETLSGAHDLREATSSASGRADFLHQVAHIHSLTPSVVPYQNGETYSYFAVALIPRLLWPDKPTAGNANGFFAVTYGLTTEEGAKTTTFGVSILGEAFINFGWLGVILIMFFQGFIVGLLERTFGGLASGPGGQAVFIAFFVFFLNGIGTSAEILFGNILQNLLCGFCLLLWAREKRPSLRLPDQLSATPPLLSGKLLSR